MKIAVTGSIGSGKSSFCNYLSQKGFPLINADEISKIILANDPEVRKKVIKEFGKDSFVENKINKEFLSKKIFSDPVLVLKINSILHPKVKKEIEAINKDYLNKGNLVFTEAALIYEADMESMFDYVVLITASYEIRKKRILEKGKINEEDFEKRNNNQIQDEEKKKRADFTFENNGSLGELKIKADLLISILNGLKAKSK